MEPHARLIAELEDTPYRLVRPLARGAMGEVVIVEHRDLGDPRVMKILRADLAPQASDTLAARLRAEARLLTRLVHPNLVRVLDFGRLPSNRAFLLSELLDGEPLSALIKREAPLPMAIAVRLARETLAGLAVVHTAGIVHRDIKPDNLFVTKDGLLKILDFGVAKVLTHDAKEAAGTFAPTATAMIVGTPAYISPEQIRATGVDARADLYAVGCVLYAMLSGRAPFRAATQIDLMRAHLYEAPRPIDGLDPGLQRVMLRALAKEPADRFTSADDMRSALASALSSAVLSPRGGTLRIELPTVESVPRPPTLASDRDEDTGVGTRWEGRFEPAAPVVAIATSPVPDPIADAAGEPGEPTVLYVPTPAPSRARRSAPPALIALLLLLLALVAILVALRVGWWS
ncbi:MAG: serine/threonine-protein kinase [Polyangiaceae bacterium]